ncbi:MAG: amidohydrolase [Phototrophicales bacterium]
MSDILFHHAQIITMDNTHPLAKAMLVDAQGRILALDPQYIPENATHIDLKGTTIIPGFYDSHCHLWKWGLRLTAQVDVSHVESVVKTLREYAEKRPVGKWIIARGTQANITQADLDAVSTDHPIVFSVKEQRIVNTAAIRAAGLNLSDSVLSVSAEKKIRAAMPPLKDEDYVEAILTACYRLIEMGVTAAADPLLTPRLTRIYREIEADLPIRVVGYPIRRAEGATTNDPMPDYYSSKQLKIDGVKFFADGGATNMTAGVSQPYINGKKGRLYYNPTELKAEMQAVADCGLGVITHAIGDEAIGMVLEAYTGLDVACRIEHLGLPTQEQLQQAADMGVMVSTQPAFLPAFGGQMRRVLNPAYHEFCYPFRAMFDAGIMTAFSSDMPFVQTPHPLHAIQAAQDRLCEDGLPLAEKQSVTWEEAIRAYTLHGAVVCGDAADYGSLSPGKWADFVVLNNEEIQHVYIHGKIAQHNKR